MYISVRDQQEQNIFNLILVIMSNPTKKSPEIKSEMSSEEYSKYTNSSSIILIQISRTPSATAKLNFYYKIEVYLHVFKTLVIQIWHV